jgi:FecR protein
MKRRQVRGMVLSVLVMAVAGLVAVGLAEAKPGSAALKAVTGRVEIQKKGDSQWAPAVVGAQLVEGDNIRAWAGSSARLDLPDGSTIFVAENSRIVIAKLEFDPRSQHRQAFFHLAVGKVRAAVSQAAIRLVKARQSNFTISTPTAVAAARGTVFEVVYDAMQNTMRVAVIVKDPQRAAGLVSCLSLADRYSSVLVREGLATVARGTSGCAPPIPISLLPDASLVGTLFNPITPGASFTAPISVPSIPDAGGAPPVIFTSEDAPSPVPPSTIGVDIGQLPPSQQSASNPPNP